MQFYKISANLKEEIEAVEEDDRRIREEAHTIEGTIMDFNIGYDDRFIFVSHINRREICMGCITLDTIDVPAFTEKFAKAINKHISDIKFSEVTLSSIYTYARTASRRGFLEDEDFIFEKFGIEGIAHNRGLGYGENLCKSDVSREDVEDSAKTYFMNETLLPEIERIYEGKKLARVKGHPVHYVVETDNFDTRREVSRLILCALRANGRLDCSRYAFVDFGPDSEFSRTSYDELYKSCSGGAVIVRYNSDESEDGDVATSKEFVIEAICEVAKRYKNKTLTIFCFPRECKHIKAEFYKQLGNMSFVEICEDLIDYEGAKAVLADLARKNKIRSDKRLFEELDESATYLSDELVRLFECWYDNKIKASVYPQYKNVHSANNLAVKEAPKGSAYEELSEMIGLSEAKDVIKKAINFYKMQKLYEERGIKQSTPAMHMIFTGNPGTAKTTAARLFARIMRENKLLSKGHLVEVGRSDLVARYVGWTAKTVQEKFRQAKGGVLFIDEAYSLADGSNSFGAEAINTIVQEMENHRDELVVIFAGYTKEMEEFLQKNPGLRSRIAFHVPFADYDSEELCQIAKLISKKNGMKFDEGAISKLNKVFDTARVNSDFGNGRYVRNIFEQAKMNQASRLLEKDICNITTEEITTLTADDIVIPVATKPNNMRKVIGF